MHHLALLEMNGRRQVRKLVRFGGLLEVFLVSVLAVIDVKLAKTFLRTSLEVCIWDELDMKGVPDIFLTRSQTRTRSERVRSACVLKWLLATRGLGKQLECLPFY